MGMVVFNRRCYQCKSVEFYGDIMLLDGWCVPLYHRGQNYVLDISKATFRTKLFGDLGNVDNTIDFKKIVLKGSFNLITVRTGGVLMRYVIDGDKEVVLAS